MSSARLILFAWGLVGTAIGCRDATHRDDPVVVCRIVGPAAIEGARTSQSAPDQSAQEPIAPTAEPSAREQVARAPISPPVEQTERERAPQAPVEPAPTQVIVVTPQQGQGAPAAPTSPEYAPPSPIYAPTAPATITDAGVVVPAVPLNIDPGAEPGAPGNGAPNRP